MSDEIEGDLVLKTFYNVILLIPAALLGVFSLIFEPLFFQLLTQLGFEVSFLDPLLRLFLFFAVVSSGSWVMLRFLALPILLPEHISTRL